LPIEGCSFELPSDPDFFPTALELWFFFSSAALNFALWSSDSGALMQILPWSDYLLTEFELQIDDIAGAHREF
jgi:hypothetical protein